MKFFSNVETLEELRRQYKELLKKYHPDNPGGSTEVTKMINVEYDSLFKVLKDGHENQTTEKNFYENNKYDFNEDILLREMLQKIISLQGVTIEICGSWLWVFNSYDCRKQLKEAGFKYAPKKQAWYWHSEAFRKKSHKVLSMNDIRSYYGSTKFSKTENEKIAAH